LFPGRERGVHRAGRERQGDDPYAKEHAITIAVMGCRVNGPGETDDADLGLWCGPTKVNLKRGSEELGAFGYDEILPRLAAIRAPFSAGWIATATESSIPTNKRVRPNS
jgi:4-hydroxy-3-methylbut-2-en-1-yl diphosphate synthase IspG/GcpE